MDGREDAERYVVPRWPEGRFNLVALEGGFELGPFTANSWVVGDRGDLVDWRDEDGAHPVRLRVRMQAGDLLYANNGDLGPMTYRMVPVTSDGVTSDLTAEAVDLGEALSALWPFLGRGALTSTIASLERDLHGRRACDIQQVLEEHGVSPATLESGLVARDRLGRINDVIHATAMVIALPTILEPDERITRPSLAAGNDPTRPFDLETDQRIAEFKLSRWDGHDTARKRQLVKDLVHLAADRSGRRAQLFVLDERPLHFLAETRSTMAWAIDRFPPTQALYLDRFGDLLMPISGFYEDHASHVEVVDLRPGLGHLLAAVRRRETAS